MFGKSPKIKDRRMLATSTIMSGMIGALAMCIPLCIVTKMSVLPILVIAGAALSTAAVWVFGKPVDPEGASRKEVDEMNKTIADLRERLENVEVMSRYESTLIAPVEESTGAAETIEAPAASREPARTMGGGE